MQPRQINKICQCTLSTLTVCPHLTALQAAGLQHVGRCVDEEEELLVTGWQVLQLMGACSQSPSSIQTANQLAGRQKTSCSWLGGRSCGNAQQHGAKHFD